MSRISSAVGPWDFLNLAISDSMRSEVIAVFSLSTVAASK